MPDRERLIDAAYAAANEGFMHRHPAKHPVSRDRLELGVDTVLAALKPDDDVHAIVRELTDLIDDVLLTAPNWPGLLAANARYMSIVERAKDAGIDLTKPPGDATSGDE